MAEWLHTVNSVYKNWQWKFKKRCCSTILAWQTQASCVRWGVRFYQLSLTEVSRSGSKLQQLREVLLLLWQCRQRRKRRKKETLTPEQSHSAGETMTDVAWVTNYKKLYSVSLQKARKKKGIVTRWQKVEMCSWSARPLLNKCRLRTRVIKSRWCLCISVPVEVQFRGQKLLACGSTIRFCSSYISKTLLVCIWLQRDKRHVASRTNKHADNSDAWANASAACGLATETLWLGGTKGWSGAKSSISENRGGE